MGLKLKTFLILSLIIVFAFSVRVYNLENVPGVYPDEAVNGEDALQALQTGNFQWFYSANQGREGLFMNLVALSFRVFEPSPFSLKFPAVIFSVLTALGTYFLAKELFGRRNVALIAAFLNAFAFWSINFGRISFRANMLPFVLVWSFYFLFRAIREKKILYFALSGLIFGLGMHTYIAFRIAPAIAIVLLAVFILSRKNFFHDYWKGAVTFLIFSFLSAAPIFHTFWEHPEYLESRSANISVFSPEVNQGNLFGTFFKSFSLSLLKYNFFGDMNWRHNFPPYPILDPITGTAFLFGIIYSFVRFFHLLYLRFKKKELHDKLVVHTFLLAWFFIMLAPEFLTAEGNPHALRAIGTIPVVFLFSALTFSYILKKSLHFHGYFAKKATLPIIVVLLIGVGIFNVAKYHLVWAQKTETARSFERGLMNVSAYLKALPTDTEKIVATGNMQRVPIKIFNTRTQNLKLISPEEAENLQPTTSRTPIIILTEKNDALIAKLQSAFPKLSLEEQKDRFGISFYVLK